ncbi:MAG: DUF192 domain-containing protein [Candidatus Omnitrophica bacterium]|nr:DUF192 domain-containing protein [Candidatus Omnitrophota bacterium]
MTGQFFYSLIFFVLSFFFAGCRESASQPPQACFKENCFTVELAVSPEERERGLMYREKLAQGAGMLFIFDKEDVYSFWMKNTKIPLDIIWLDSQKRVVYIGANIPPCVNDPCPSYNPLKKALYVLEIPSGAAVKSQIAVGDVMRY